MNQFYELVAQRRLRRFYPGILAGLTLLYLLTFPILKAGIWVTIPVAVAGWFYYKKTGFLAGILAASINLFLINRYVYELSLARFLDPAQGIALGHFFVIIVGAALGFLREELENVYRTASKNRVRERQLILVNLMVKDILETKNIDQVYYLLLNHLCNLFVADYAYMFALGEVPSDVTLVAMTRNSEGPPAGSLFSLEETVITEAALKSGHVLVIEEAQTSQLVARSPLFGSNRSMPGAVIGIPLIARDYDFGVVILAFEKPQKFDREELSYFELTSSQITLALRGVLQEHKIERQLKEAQALAAIEHALSQSEKISLDLVLQLIVNSARKLIPKTTHAVLHLLDEEQQVLVPRAVAGDFEGRKSHLNMRLREGVAGQVLFDGRAATISDIRSDARFANQAMPVASRSIAVAPVLLNEKRIGTVSVLSPEVGSFRSDEVNLLNSLATLSAIAIENATLYSSMQEEILARIQLEQALRDSVAAERELRLTAETTAEASFALVSKVDEGVVLDEILAQVERILPGCAYNIKLIEEGHFLKIRSDRGYEEYDHDFHEPSQKVLEPLPLELESIRTRQVVVVADTHAETNWAALPAYAWIRSHLSIPLLWKDQLLGILNIDHEKPNMFSEQIAERLNVLVNVAAAAIANAQLLKNTRQALNEINSLYIISREMVTLDVNFLLTNAVELLQENFGYYQVLIYMHDPVSGDLVLRYASGSVGQALLEQKHRLPAGTGIVGYIYDTGAPFFTHNVEEVAFFIRNPLLPETRSEMGVPLKIAGYTLGVIDIQQAAPHSLTARDLRLVSSVADQLSVNLYNANLYEDLQSVLQNEQTMRSQLIQSERLAIVGRLLASISHELNNPLQAIHNILFLLKRDEKFSAQGKQDLEIIISEIERMTSLIGRLRATYQPQLDEIRDIELHNIIEDVYVLTATYMRHRNIAFEFCPDENLPVLAGIPGQLRQVLLNLFLNAIDAMPGGGELMVQTQNLPEEKQILLTVSDTGVGISPDIMPHLFEPFITDKDTGTGLGMTITRDIILQHHGNIQATNNPTGGAVFKIWLPAPSTD